MNDSIGSLKAQQSPTDIENLYRQMTADANLIKDNKGFFMRFFSFFIITVFGIILAGCSSGGHSTKKAGASTQASSSTSIVFVNSSVSSSGSSEAARGELMKSSTRHTFSASAEEFHAQLNSTLDGRYLLGVAGTPVCGVDVHYYQYGTVGALGEPATASGALMIPIGDAGGCSSARPVLLYAHGTALNRRYNLAGLRDNSNEAQSEAHYIAATYAAQGYIVVAPNYIGYEGSNTTYHAYLNADQQSKEMMDALHAAKLALNRVSNTSASEKLFISGYSQGGHVAMATHRAMQEAGITVTASAPMSGPYALAAQSDAVFYGYVAQYGVFLSALTITSMQIAYGNIYSDPADFFESPYAADVESLLPSLDVSKSLTKLPRSELFSDSSPDVWLPSSTAPLSGPEFDTLYSAGLGTGNLIRDSARNAYLEDAVANPDGGFPLITDGLSASAPENPLRQAAKANDLRNWTPETPLLLCAGHGDPMVYFLNSKLMADLWSDLPAGRVSVLDVDSPESAADSADPYYGIKVKFNLAKSELAEQPNGASALLEAYHGDLVFSACLAASQRFFAQF